MSDLQRSVPQCMIPACRICIFWDCYIVFVLVGDFKRTWMRLCLYCVLLNIYFALLLCILIWSSKCYKVSSSSGTNRSWDRTGYTVFCKSISPFVSDGSMGTSNADILIMRPPSYKEINVTLGYMLDVSDSNHASVCKLMTFVASWWLK